jgi:hypothetical protein
MTVSELRMELGTVIGLILINHCFGKYKDNYQYKLYLYSRISANIEYYTIKTRKTM